MFGLFVCAQALLSVQEGIMGTHGSAEGAFMAFASDAEKLAAYDAFAADVRAELEGVASRMDELKAAGRMKTATYRQLFAARITLKDIDRRLGEHGL